MRIPKFLLDPFEAEKVGNPFIVFFDETCSEVNEEFFLDNYAYVGPDGLDEPKSTAPRKTFYAERYGGVGIGSNGGGARCGTDGRWLVKGMGSNQLLGVDSAFWYGHGTLPLVDAIAEAIWAKMLKHALPFGALDTPAVIATGRMSWTRERGGARKEHPGALMIRSAALRLASFERAIYFKPKWGPDDGLINRSALVDVQRTKSAINFLPSAMPVNGQPEGASPKSSYSDENEAVIEGLRNVGQRIAMQSAAASAKRIMHGALTGSNIALDSRWMDLGCVTGLNNFGLPASFKPSMWREYRKLHESICNILYYSMKYNKSCKRMNIRKESIEICEHIDGYYNRYLLMFLLERCGFPSDLVNNAFSEIEILDFARSLLDIAQCGTAVDHDRFYERGDGIGSYDFYEICTVLSSGIAPERMLNILNDKLNSAEKSERIMKDYKAASSVINSRIGNADGKIALNNLINVNCTKSSFTDKLFFRQVLNSEIENAIENEGVTAGLRSRVDEITNRMELFFLESLKDNNGLRSFCGKFKGEDLFYCSQSNSFELHGRQGVVKYSLSSILSGGHCPISSHINSKFKIHRYIDNL